MFAPRLVLTLVPGVTSSARRRAAAILFGILLVSLPSIALVPETDAILPVAGRVGGAFGSQFYTTVWITNPGTEPASVVMQFSPAARTPIRITTTLAAGESRTYENITEELFAAPGILGSLRFRSSEKVLVTARIYIRFDGAPESDTHGVSYSALPSSAAIGAGMTSDLQGGRSRVRPEDERGHGQRELAAETGTDLVGRDEGAFRRTAGAAGETRTLPAQARGRGGP